MDFVLYGPHRFVICRKELKRERDAELSSSTASFNGGYDWKWQGVLDVTSWVLFYWPE